MHEKQVVSFFSLHECLLQPNNLASIGRSCPKLEYLDLTGVFGISVIQPEQVGWQVIVGRTGLPPFYRYFILKKNT